MPYCLNLILYVKIFIMIYIVLVNYKNSSDTIECINSLLNSDFEDYKIIVIDNSPTETFINEIKVGFDYEDLILKLEEKDFFETESLYFKITLVKSNVNNGFAAANNIALKKILKFTNWDYVWLLNNDTIVESDSISKIYSFALKHPYMGIVGNVILDYFEPDKVQILGGLYNPIFSVTKAVGANCDKNKIIENFTFDYIPGASMFVKKAFIEHVGFMCEDYFLYFEELDWALRGKKHAWKQGVCLNSKIYHKGGQSINGKETVSLLSDFYGLRNRLLFTKKFYNKYIIPFFAYYLLVIISRILKFNMKRVKISLVVFKYFFRSSESLKKIEYKF